MCSRTVWLGSVSSSEGFREFDISRSNSESSPAILIHRCDTISGTVIRRRASVHSSRRIRSSHSVHATPQHKMAITEAIVLSVQTYTSICQNKYRDSEHMHITSKTATPAKKQKKFIYQTIKSINNITQYTMEGCQ